MAGGSRLDNNVFARKLAPFGRFLTGAITIRVLSLTLTSVSGPGPIQNRYVFSQHPCCSRDSKVVFSSMLVATCAISSGFLWIDEFGTWLLTRVGYAFRRGLIEPRALRHLENLNKERWFKKHPNVHFHFPDALVLAQSKSRPGFPPSTASLTAPPSPPSIYKGLSASVQKTAYYSTPVLG